MKIPSALYEEQLENEEQLEDEEQLGGEGVKGFVVFACGVR